MKIISFCLKYIAGQWGLLIFYFFACMITTGISIAIPYVMGNFIDMLSTAETPGFILDYCVKFAFLNISVLMMGYFSRLAYAKAQINVTYALSKRIIAHVHDSKFLESGKMDPAYLNQRISQDAGAVISFTINAMSETFLNILTLLYVLGLMLSMSVRLTLASGCFLVIYIISFIFSRKPLYKRGLALREQQSFYFAKMYEQINYTKFVKTHSAKEFFAKRLNAAFVELKKTYMPYQYISFLYGRLDGLISSAAQIALLFIGGYEIINGSLTIGLFTTLSGYFSRMLISTGYFFGLGKSYQDVLISYDRIQNILKWEREISGQVTATDINRIKVTDFSFSYGDKRIVENLNIEFIKGQTYALTGDNGTGKSTLINAVLGLFNGNFNGDILYNDTSVLNYDTDSIRYKNIGVSDQEPVILNDSVINNLYLDNDYALGQQEKLAHLIDLLKFTAFIAGLPQNIETIISQKSGLSGGEKQKLGIARVLLKDPDVMIFDEPTSALDSDTAASFLQYISSIKTRKIIIIITHDRHVINFCDNIVALTKSSKLNN